MPSNLELGLRRKSKHIVVRTTIVWLVALFVGDSILYFLLDSSLTYTNIHLLVGYSALMTFPWFVMYTCSRILMARLTIDRPVPGGFYSLVSLVLSVVIAVLVIWVASGRIEISILLHEVSVNAVGVFSVLFAIGVNLSERFDSFICSSSG